MPDIQAVWTLNSPRRGMISETHFTIYSELIILFKIYLINIWFFNNFVCFMPPLQSFKISTCRGCLTLIFEYQTIRIWFIYSFISFTEVWIRVIILILLIFSVLREIIIKIFILIVLMLKIPMILII